MERKWSMLYSLWPITSGVKLNIYVINWDVQSHLYYFCCGCSAFVFQRTVQTSVWFFCHCKLALFHNALVLKSCFTAQICCDEIVGFKGKMIANRKQCLCVCFVIAHPSKCFNRVFCYITHWDQKQICSYNFYYNFIRSKCLPSWCCSQFQWPNAQGRQY